jgi:GNAT superfamily N-acetyltransferase
MRFTPGELVHFHTNPHKALAGEYVYHFVRNESGDIIGVSSFMENEQQTGGYSWDYFVVHRAYRNQGIATLFFESMMNVLLSVKARYVVTYTCDLDCYRPVRQLFERFGFEMAGRCPDYYFDGEGRIIYYRKLSGL